MGANVTDKLLLKYPGLLPEQIKFYKTMDEVLTVNRTNGMIYANSARCGIGKSRYIAELIECVSNAENHEGIIIITDSVKRLRNYVDNDMSQLIQKHRNKICVMEAENISETIILHKYRPILLMTTQRFFQLTQEERLELLHYEGGERTKIICDEELILLKQTNINLDTLNRLDTALNDGIDNLANQTEKEWCIEQFELLREHIQSQLKRYEAISEKKQYYLWHVDNWKALTKDDERFFHFIRMHKRSLNGYYPDAYNMLLAIKQLLVEGGVFQCAKRGNGKNLEYSKMFSVIMDNRQDLINLGVDIYVLDATADISPVYDYECIEVTASDEYNVSLENLTIEIVNINTSKNKICGRSAGASSKFNSAVKYLQNCNGNMAVFSYKELEKKLYEHFPKCGYFGNLRGFNDYRECDVVAQIGLNRFPPLTYFLLHTANDPTELNMIKSLPIEKQIEAFDKCVSKSSISDNDMFWYILADLEQNIFRCAIRNMPCEQPIKAIIFLDHKEFADLIDLIKWRYSKLGVNIVLVDTPEELKVEKILSRKNVRTEKSHAQIIIDWYNQQTKGRFFKLKEMLQEIGITNKQFDKAKENNSSLQTIFDSMKTGKRGYYCI